MHPLRLISATVIASTIILHAAAQSPTPKPAPQPYILQPDTLQPTPHSFPIAPFIPQHPFEPLTTFPTQVSFVLNAQNQTTCFAIRSYGFTAKDLQSPNPHASTYTECSPDSTVGRKEIHIVLPARTVTTIQTIPTK